jgi:hypothetical protein
MNIRGITQTMLFATMSSCKKNKSRFLHDDKKRVYYWILTTEITELITSILLIVTVVITFRLID